MTDVEKSEIFPIWHVYDVENVAIHAKYFEFNVDIKAPVYLGNWATLEHGMLVRALFFVPFSIIFSTCDNLTTFLFLW